MVLHALIAKNLTVTQTVSPHQPHLQIMIRIVRLHNMTLCMESFVQMPMKLFQCYAIMDVVLMHLLFEH